MIRASSSTTLKAARKHIVKSLICLEHHRAWAASLGRKQQRTYVTKTSGSEQQRGQPFQPVPTATQTGPRTDRSSSNPRVKPKSPGGNPESQRMLRPYVLSRRLTGLASRGQLDEAIVMLQNSPSDASNVKTWNTLLWLCMKNQRFKLGYKLFSDMKRRGFVPNTRTYNLLLAGLSRIEKWEEHTLQFKNAQALWRSFLRYIEHLKKTNPGHSDIEPNPAAFYISILAANKEYNSIFDVLNDLDHEGRFSPTEFIYSKTLQAITYRSQLTPGDKEKLAYRNASDAKLLWKDLSKRAAKNPELVSDRIILYLLKTLMKGRLTDQLYAFDFVRDYLGLSKPGEEAPQRRVKLSPITLDAVLLLCLATENHRLCIHYVRHLMDEAGTNDRECIIDQRHIDRALESHVAMTIAGSAGESRSAVETIEWMHRYHALGLNVEPQASTYGWGLMTCWRGGDWASAVRIAELMTGCHAEDFVDDSPNLPSPRLDNRSKGRMFVPDVRNISCLLRAASGSDEVANMRQCLRMTTFFGDLRSSSIAKSMNAYLDRSSANAAVAGRGESFYFMKMASALVQVLTRVLEGTDPVADTPEMKAWRELRIRTNKILRESSKSPESESQLLGSSGALEATERFVDRDLARRSQKSGRSVRQ